MISIFKLFFILSVLLFLTTEKNFAKAPTSNDSNVEKNKNTKTTKRNISTDTAIDWMQFFPNELSFIKLGESTKEESIKALGKSLKIDENQNLFYELSGIKYDTTIGIKENKVSYILYSPPANSLSLPDLKSYIPQTILEASQKQSNRETAHSSNRTYDITWPAQGITITVRNNSRESIESLLYFK